MSEVSDGRIWVWGTAGSLILHGLAAVAILAWPQPAPDQPVPVVVVDMVPPTPSPPAPVPAPAPAPVSPSPPAAAAIVPTPPKPQAPSKPVRQKTVRPPDQAAPTSPSLPPLPASEPVADAATAATDPAPFADNGATARHGTAGAANGGGGTRAGSAAAPADPAAMDRWLAIVRGRLAQALVFPERARKLGLAGKVQVQVAIQADGRVTDGSLTVVLSSGGDLLDQAALATIRAAAPFPPPPEGALTLVLPVSFTLTGR